MEKQIVHKKWKFSQIHFQCDVSIVFPDWIQISLIPNYALHIHKVAQSLMITLHIHSYIHIICQRSQIPSFDSQIAEWIRLSLCESHDTISLSNSVSQTRFFRGSTHWSFPYNWTISPPSLYFVDMVAGWPRRTWVETPIWTAIAFVCMHWSLAIWMLKLHNRKLFWNNELKDQENLG